LTIGSGNGVEEALVSPDGYAEQAHNLRPAIMEGVTRSCFRENDIPSAAWDFQAIAANEHKLSLQNIEGFGVTVVMRWNAFTKLECLLEEAEGS
jgi:hypothetical protein